MSVNLPGWVKWEDREKDDDVIAFNSMDYEGWLDDLLGTVKNWHGSAGAPTVANGGIVAGKGTKFVDRGAEIDRIQATDPTDTRDYLDLDNGYQLYFEAEKEAICTPDNGIGVWFSGGHAGADQTLIQTRGQSPASIQNLRKSSGNAFRWAGNQVTIEVSPSLHGYNLPDIVPIRIGYAPRGNSDSNTNSDGGYAWLEINGSIYAEGPVNDTTFGLLEELHIGSAYNGALPAGVFVRNFMLVARPPMLNVPRELVRTIILSDSFYGVNGVATPLFQSAPFRALQDYVNRQGLYFGEIIHNISETEIDIAAITAGATTNIRTSSAHGRTTGDEVIIRDVTGNTPDINGVHTITVVDADEFTIAVNTTVAGTGGEVEGGVGTTTSIGGAQVTTALPGKNAADYFPAAVAKYQPSSAVIRIATNDTDQDLSEYVPGGAFETALRSLLTSIMQAHNDPANFVLVIGLVPSMAGAYATYAEYEAARPNTVKSIPVMNERFMDLLDWNHGFGTRFILTDDYDAWGGENGIDIPHLTKGDLYRETGGTLTPTDDDIHPGLEGGVRLGERDGRGLVRAVRYPGYSGKV